jgi:glycosyltransferase involved in cell wall biosynthesis
VAVEEQAARFGLPLGPSVVRFPWGVDLGRFSPAPSAPIDIVNLISTRNWEPAYGIETLLKAFALAVRKDGRLRLTMLGSGSLANRIRALIAGLGLSELVNVVGVVPQRDVPAYFREAHAYISCSPSDGSSISLLESLASGLPVVVADSPGNREWVVEGQNGWLVPPQEPSRYADALLVCASLTEREYLDMSRRNRSLAVARADWSKNLFLLFGLYERMRSQGSEGGSRH